jgi:hypothetical protein
MAAGQGFKTFTSGDVLTAADVNGYLMQGVGVFADATERDAEITSPEEGQFAYLKDTNVTTYYTGSAWANLDTTGMTNPMTTTGDTIYSSSGSTPARLGIGTAGQVLRVNSGATAPEWATAASGGMTLISTTTLTGSTVTLSSIPSTYKNLRFVVRNIRPSSDGEQLYIIFNGDSGTRYRTNAWNTANGQFSFNTEYIQLSTTIDNGASDALINVEIPDYANTTTWKMCSSLSMVNNSAAPTQMTYNAINGFYNQTSAINSITFFMNGNFTSGTVLLYGVS